MTSSALPAPLTPARAETREGGAAPSGSAPGEAASVPSEGLEAVVAARAAALLERVGDGATALHAAVMEQAERGLLRAVLTYTRNHLGRASKILGLDRNTCARKARAFGLMVEPSRGRKPQPKKPKRVRGRARGKARRAADKHPGK